MREDLIEKIRMKWGRFSRSQLQALKGDLDQLIDLIQTVYKCSRSRAELEYHEFQLTLRPVPIRNSRGY
jgi:hypothetical protein